MLATIHAAAVNGLSAILVYLEIDCKQVPPHQPTPSFIMVGLPDNTVRESRMRVEAALQRTGIVLPNRMSYRVNLAPADVRKEGSGFDLPLAIGMLVSLQKLQPEEDLLKRTLFVGELGFDGSLRPVKGALSIAIKARAEGYEHLIVPKANVREAAVVNRLKVYGAETLQEVIGFLKDPATLLPTVVNTREEFYAAQTDFPFDFADVKGQESVKRAFEIAAAGGHNLILIGSPGCGKSMMAKRLPSILPQLTLAESLETTQIHSVAGQLDAQTSLIAQRPFRAPHHTISDVALIGGGATYKPGEISLAHNGVLFLDELPEFSRSALETLRQPLEDREITISRSKYTATLPCSFMLIASMNPCPCGYYGHPSGKCHCLPGQIQKYMNRISGPLLDRIDIQIMVNSVSVDDLANAPKGESSADIRARVIAARDIQTKRFKGIQGLHCNAQMQRQHLERFATLSPEAREVLTRAMQRMGLSARAYDRILKVARTIADLDRSAEIGPRHVKEAVQYRNLDRNDWGE